MQFSKGHRRIKSIYFTLKHIIPLLLLAACDSSDPLDPGVEPLPHVVVDGSTGFFATEEGSTFIPWGYNYTTDRASLLIEDRWDNEAEWDIITEDFAEMKAYGANTVRIHLQFHEFMRDPRTPDPEALSNLARLLEVAEETGVYLDVTGLAAYRKEDQPAWYDTLDESARWAAQTVFWEAVATTLAHSDNVFAYNLMNEPVVLSTPQIEWLPGDGFGGFHFVQSLTRDLGSRSQVDVFNQWIAMQAEAVRRGDPRHLVTVGFLPLGDLNRFEGSLDFLSTHIYPEMGNVNAAVDYTLGNIGGKPLLIEEIGPVRAGRDDLLSYMDQVNQSVAGFLGHYMGLTASELASQGTIGAALQREFLIAFSARSPATGNSQR